jgi:Xaa-Pro aminopeptidase
MPTALTPAEHARRLADLRAAMARDGLDALLVAGKGHAWTGRGYVRYLTDFHLWGHDALVLVPLDGEPVGVLTSPAVARKVAARGFVADVRGDFNLVGAAADAVRERGLAGGRIGLVGHRWILPAGLLDALRSALPTARFGSADRLFDEVRSVKSPLEVAQARELWPVMQAAMDAFADALAPGRTQQEATAEAFRALYARGARDVLAFIGEDPTDVGPPTAAPLRCDGVVRLHIEFCGASGHWCERTVVHAFRDQAPEEAAIEAAELAAYDAVRGAATPGTPARIVSDVFEQVLEEHGYRVGAPSHHFDLHGQGLDAIEWPRVSSADPAGTDPDAPLREGQVFSYHPFRAVTPPHVWGPDLHDNVLVTSGGFERLSGDWDLGWRRMT